MSIKCHHVVSFPFRGVVPPVLGVGGPSPRHKVLFLPTILLWLCPQAGRAAGSATLLCPAASDLHSERWSQSSALYNSTAKLILGQSNSTDPWGRRSFTVESQAGIAAFKCISISPIPEIRILIFKRSERSHRPFASKQPPAVQHSPKELKHFKAQGRTRLGQPKGAQGSPCPAVWVCTQVQVASFLLGAGLGRRCAPVFLQTLPSLQQSRDTNS